MPTSCSSNMCLSACSERDDDEDGFFERVEAVDSPGAARGSKVTARGE
jgi:hypothetical protein